MRITKNLLFSVLLSFLFTTTIIQLFSINLGIITAAISLATLIFVPGILGILIIRVRSLYSWDLLAATMGLGITFLMGMGLAVNFLLPAVGIKNPLDLYPLLFCFDLMMLTAGLIAYIRTKEKKIIQFEVNVKPLEAIFYIVPPLLLALSVLGAQSINNGGTNLLTMILYASIAGYVLLMCTVIKKISFSSIAYSIFFISLSLLLSTSLRASFVTGHDIQLEYYAFQFTKEKAIWGLTAFNSAYNACLSITILPTILSNFLHINDNYIYKVVYQILFSIVPVICFVIFSKHAARLIAFLAAFNLMLFPTFVNDMTMLNRQEIAFIFFALMLLVLLHKKMRPRIKNILFILFGFGMVFSHYSTTYMTIGIFVATFATIYVLKNSIFNKLLGNLMKKSKSIKIVDLTNRINYLTFPMVVGLLIIAFFWVWVTHSGNNLSNVTSKVFFSLNKPSTGQSKSSDTLYNILNFKKKDNNQLLSDYVNDGNKKIQESEFKEDYYSQDLTKNYKVKLASEEVLPLTPFGERLSRLHINPFLIVDILRQLYARLIQLLVFVGIIGFLFYKKKRSKVDLNYVSLCLAGTGILFAQVLLPAISAEYGILRAFQQALMFLALPVTLGCIALFKIFTKKYSVQLTALLFTFYFLVLVGFVQQITGGYFSALRLNNSGLYYDMYYTHQNEVATMDWFAGNRDEAEPVQASVYTGSKLLANEGIFSTSDMLPQTIKKDSYIFVDDSKAKNKKDIVFYKGDLLIYDYPINFFDENKNLVYNNGGSKIYK